MDAGLGIGAGSNIVGGLMQSIAAGMANRAMSKQFQRELERQQAHRNQAFGTFETATPFRGVETAGQQIQQGAANREQAYHDISQAPLSIGGAQPTGRDQARYDLQGKSRANLGGYSDWALNQMISNIRTQDELNKITNFAAGDASVFPYRMYEAQHKGDELAFWGSLISSIGGGAGSFLNSGGQGGGPPFGSIYQGAGGNPYMSVPNQEGGGYSYPIY